MLTSPGSGILKNFGAKMFPGYAIRRQVRDRIGNVREDMGNFQSADDLRSLLLAYDVVSFDYFDTLASRNVALAAVQDMTARYGATLLSAHVNGPHRDALRYSRMWFSEQLKRHYMTLPGERYRNEVQLDDLLDRVLAAHVADASERRRLVDAIVRHEAGIERLVLEPHEDFVSLIRHLKSHGKTVILTSDMYLSRRDIVGVLKHQGLHDLFDRIYVSATSGVTKNSGALFDLVERDLPHRRLRRFHVGDNFVNDVLRPREKGWTALHFFQPDHEARRMELELAYRLGPATERTRYERFEARYRVDGMPRALRLLAASFAVFARRLVERAQRGGVDSIYFLTRDGLVFQKIVEDFLQSSHGRGLLEGRTMEVIALNRRMGVILDYPGIDDGDWLAFNVGYLNDTPVSLRTIMKTFAVRPDDLEGLTPREERLVARCLRTPQVMDLSMENLAKRPGIRRALDRALAVKKDRARLYLRQKGLLDPDRSIMLVDIGYSGTVLKSLSSLFFQEQARTDADVGARVELCMFAGNRFLPDNLGRMHPRCHVEDGLVLNSASAESRALCINFSWLEPFCLDRDLGTLRGYARAGDGTLAPVFDTAVPDEAYADLRRDILQSARTYFDLAVQSNLDLDRLDAMVVEEMTRAFARPSAETVELVKTHVHHAGNADSAYETSVRRMKWARLYPELVDVLSSDKWAQGSLRESGLPFLTPALNYVISKAIE